MPSTKKTRSTNQPVKQFPYTDLLMPSFPVDGHDKKSRKEYTGMMRRRSLAPALCIAAALAACSAEPPPADVVVRAARQALVPTMLLMDEVQVLPQFLRPAVGIGIYSASSMALHSPFSVVAALQGIDSGLAMLPSTAIARDAFVAIAELGTALDVDLWEYLNRSENRAKDLSEYVAILQRLTDEGRIQQAALDVRVDDLNAARRDKRSVVSGVERTIKDAVRERNFALAGSMQEVLIREQAELSKIEVELEQAKSGTDIYDDLLQMSDERLSAIAENREVLIAGLRVTDVPGVENLDILQGKNRRRSRF